MQKGCLSFIYYYYYFLFIHFFLLMSFGLCLTGRKQFENLWQIWDWGHGIVLIDGKI